MDQNTEYETLLSTIGDYVTVKPVDKSKTIYLLEKAKGDRSYREFSEATGASTSFISYVLNGNSFKIRPNTIAGLVCGAAPKSGVTLEEFMNSQGWVHKKDLPSFNAVYRSNIRRFLIDELLEMGYAVEYSEKYSPEQDPVNGTVMLQLRKPGTDEFMPCDFKIRTCPIVKAQEHYNTMLTSWLNETVKSNFFQKNRLFLVIDNPTVYIKLLKKAEKLRIKNDISLLLVDPQERKVISENPITKSEGWEAAPLFPPYKADPDWIKNYSFRVVRIREARALIADKMMSKGWLIWLIDPGEFQPPDQIGRINPDFTIAVKTRLRKQVFYWAFTLLLLPEDADEAAVREEICVWVSKAILYHYLGGKIDRLSLVVDNEVIYKYAFEEISTLHLSNDFSVICVSLLRGEINQEYRIPLDEEPILKEKFTLI